MYNKAMLCFSAAILIKSPKYNLTVLSISKIDFDWAKIYFNDKYISIETCRNPESHVLNLLEKSLFVLGVEIVFIVSMF